MKKSKISQENQEQAKILNNSVQCELRSKSVHKKRMSKHLIKKGAYNSESIAYMQNKEHENNMITLLHTQARAAMVQNHQQILTFYPNLLFVHVAPFVVDY